MPVPRVGQLIARGIAGTSPISVTWTPESDHGIDMLLSSVSDRRIILDERDVEGVGIRAAALIVHNEFDIEFSVGHELKKRLGSGRPPRPRNRRST